MKALVTNHRRVLVAADRLCPSGLLSFTLICAALALCLESLPPCRAATIIYGNPNPFSSSTSLSAFNVLGFKISVTQSVNLGSAGVYFASASGNCNIGLYSDAGNAPDSLLATTGAFAAPATGTIERAFLTIPILSPGDYWFALVADHSDSFGTNPTTMGTYAVRGLPLNPITTMPSFFGSAFLTTLNVPNFYLRTSAAVLAGDYSNNGAVDAADYVVWRKSQGTTTSLPNDLIGGTIGTKQYSQWRTSFGIATSSGTNMISSAQIAEPSTALLCVVCVSAILSHRQRTAPYFAQPSGGTGFASVLF
jgi:hypothetical protein